MTEQPVPLVFKQSRAALAVKGKSALRIARPAEVRVFYDRVEESRPGLVPGRELVNSIRFDQVAQVAVKRGLTMSMLTVESTGGHVIAIEGLSRSAANEAKTEIEQRIAAFRSTGSAPAPRAATAASQIAELAALKDQGHLTEDEFAAAKRRLLDEN